MSLSIQTNVTSLIAQENLRVNNDFQGRTIQRLTSGFRINASGDDAAGLAVANKYRSDIAELTQGIRNANDGLSTLQIIDGGLNNVSKMLDRLKTLATQSASSTFTGNRATLNNEYQDLLAEIDRQAANIGLASGTYGGRFNTNITVYTGGGGDTQANSKVGIDLSGSANRVDAASLGLSGTNVQSGATTFLASSADLTGVTSVYKGNGAQASQVFNFHIVEADGMRRDFAVTVKGKDATTGVTVDEALTQLNDAISQYGLSATTAQDTADGNKLKLAFTGEVAFTVQVADDVNVDAASTAFVTAASSGISSTLYANSDTDNLAANFTGYTAAIYDTMTFKVGNQSVSFVLNDTNGATLDDVLNTMNDKLNALGIYAVKSESADGSVDSVSIQSKAAFSYNIAHHEAAGAVTQARSIFAAAMFDAGANPDYTMSADANAVAPSNSSGSATSAAEAALTKITTSVKSLGLVQGTVGTGQNKLQYAITLAQSQISNFSAAESRIRDADVAAEAANLTKAQVLQQASLAALAQANSAPQAVLALLRG